MPATKTQPKRRGRVRWSGPYPPNKGNAETAQRFPCLFQQRQPRPSRIHISQVAEETSIEETAQNRSHRLSNLANLRERRPFRRFNQAPKAAVVANSAGNGRNTKLQEESSEQDMLAAETQRNGGQARARSLSRASTQSRRHTASRTTAKEAITGSTSTIPQEKPVAASHGVSASIHLAEPMLFLQGFEFTDSTSSHNTAMLRGSLHVKVTKAAKLKAISLKFRGRATTHWPEGIPPKKVDIKETSSIMSHTWPFFNAQFPTVDGGTGADVVHLAGTGDERHGSPYMSSSPMGSTLELPRRDTKRLSLQVYSKSFEKGEAKPSATALKGYRTFHPGDYVYNFELPIDSRLPETCDVDLGSVKYELEAVIERAGAFKPNLNGSKEVTLIRAPTEGSLEQVEPIAISRNWDDQLHYDIVISGKSFPLGSKVPIAFKLTPLAKVQCHRIKVFVTENTEYFCSHKRVHRMEPTRKVLLFEKRADGSGLSKFSGSSMRILSGGGIPYDQRQAAAEGRDTTPLDPSNLLGRLDGDSNIGPTEMEFSVQLPGCQQADDESGKPQKLHFDTTYSNIQVHHWIKIVLRLSKPDQNDSSKRRHFEISIDSPLQILSCKASQANTALPAYSSPDDPPRNTRVAECGCPGAPTRRISPNHVPTLNSLNTTRQADNAASNASTTSLDETLADSQSQNRVRVDRGMPAAAAAAMASSVASGSSAGGARSGNTPIPPLRPPQPAHVHNQTPTIHRPMHMLRAPSFNPPAFEEEQPPPPLATPPPQYNDIASPTSGLADYFSRLADAYDEGEDSDDPDSATTRGRVNVPLTPGSRVNRSMEISRRDLWGGSSTSTVNTPGTVDTTGRQRNLVGRNDRSTLEGNAGVSESVAETTTPNAR